MPGNFLKTDFLTQYLILQESIYRGEPWATSMILKNTHPAKAEVNPIMRRGKYSQELDAARRAALASGQIQMRKSGKVKSVQLKEDDSPVSEVDIACEKVILEHLLSAFPADGVLGEEGASQKGSSGRRWIVDPLDGTRPYLRGIPTFSTLIALEDEGVPVVGMIHLPALNITAWASQGDGAFVDGLPAHVSTESRPERCIGSALGFVEKASEPLGQKLLQTMRSWNYHYGFMDAFSYVLVAQGKIDLCVNLLDKAWDCAAAACIVSEAGGIYLSAKGRSSVHDGSILLGNKTLVEKTLASLKI